MELISLLIVIGLINAGGYILLGYRYRHVIMFASVLATVFFIMNSDVIPTMNDMILSAPDEVNETLIEEPEPEPEPEVPKSLKEVRDKYIENYYSR